MKFAEINRRYTETVAEWMAKGWHINSATMGGSQGEIAKIDLTDGTDVVRIMLDSKSDFTNEDGFFYSFDTVKLIVGIANPEDRSTPDVRRGMDIIWNQNLRVISTETFYEIGWRSGRWYGTLDEAKAQQNKHFDRCSRRGEKDTVQELGDRAKAAVLPFVRRQPRCKTVKVSEIETVKKAVRYHRDEATVTYSVKVRGNWYKLH